MHSRAGAYPAAKASRKDEKRTWLALLTVRPCGQDTTWKRLELRLPLKALKNDGPTVFVADLAVFWN